MPTNMYTVFQELVFCLCKILVTNIQKTVIQFHARTQICLLTLFTVMLAHNNIMLVIAGAVLMVKRLNISTCGAIMIIIYFETPSYTDVFNYKVLEYSALEDDADADDDPILDQGIWDKHRNPVLKFYVPILV